MSGTEFMIDGENDESDYAPADLVAIPGEQREQENGDQHQPQEGQDVGEVGDAGTARRSR